MNMMQKSKRKTLSNIVVFNIHSLNRAIFRQFSIVLYR